MTRSEESKKNGETSGSTLCSLTLDCHGARSLFSVAGTHRPRSFLSVCHCPNLPHHLPSGHPVLLCSLLPSSWVTTEPQLLTRSSSCLRGTITIIIRRYTSVYRKSDQAKLLDWAGPVPSPGLPKFGCVTPYTHLHPSFCAYIGAQGRKVYAKTGRPRAPL